MSPPAASVASRRGAARRRSSGRSRRRWSLLVFVGVVLIAVGVALTAPLFRKAINEFILPLQYQDVIRQQAAEKHLDPALVAAVIHAETKFDPRTSPTGAEGLMQIEPQTAEFLARKSGATTFTIDDLATPEVNIAYGSYYLRYLIDHYHGSTELALAAYNAGVANVDRWVGRAGVAGNHLSVGDIPFAGTRAYVLRVLRAQRDYRRTYPTQLGYR